MPEPVRSGQRYLPGLDGLRAHRRTRRPRLSHRAELGAGRITGCRRLLHAERLPHHRPAARPAGQDRLAAARRLLAAPGPAAAARAVRDADRGGRLGGAVRPRPARRAARDGGLGRALREQLVADRPAPVLLLAVRPAVAARPLVVPGRGGAVLPGLALAGAARPGAEPPRRAAPRVERVLRAGRGDPAAGRGVRDGHGAALPPGLRPDPDLRRHRHPGLRAAHRGGAGVRLAQPQAARQHEQGQRLAPGRRGHRGPAGHRRADLAHHRVLRVPVPRRPGAAVGGHRDGRGGGGRAGQPGGPDARRTAGALDRRPLLRHLPVALPDHRADHPGQQHRQPGPRRAPGGREHRGGRVVVALRGRAHPARRPQALVDGAAVGRAAGRGRASLRRPACSAWLAPAWPG